MSFKLDSVIISGKEVLPIIEGGKGIGISTGASSGAFANAGAVGTFSGVNAEKYDKDGNIEPVVFHGKTRRERHEELIAMGIENGIIQAKVAHDISRGNGPIHMNVLWEMGGTQEILHGILEKAKEFIQGITCGAGMPYKLAEIAAKYEVYYYPIVSSMRAFRALWKRSYSKAFHWLGGVVYEDPWKAGGHNGLSNNEDPEVSQDPYHRLVELRFFMNQVGLEQVPIIMAGGVWHIKEWEHLLGNKEIGKIAFQFGTRPIVTKESQVPESWKKKLLTLKEGDVFLNRFSPTGYYSSAVKNNFINELQERNERQIKYSSTEDSEREMIHVLEIGVRKRKVYTTADELKNAKKWIQSGFAEALRTPDSTLIFVTPEKAIKIHEAQVNCMGCLSACKFSGWVEDESSGLELRADPRSFCIQKTLQDIVITGDVENNLLFSGHNAYRFATDSFYKNGFIPTVQQLVDRISIGY